MYWFTRLRIVRGDGGGRSTDGAAGSKAVVCAEFEMTTVENTLAKGCEKVFKSGQRLNVSARPAELWIFKLALSFKLGAVTVVRPDVVLCCGCCGTSHSLQNKRRKECGTDQICRTLRNVSRTLVTDPEALSQASCNLRSERWKRVQGE